MILVAWHLLYAVNLVISISIAVFSTLSHSTVLVDWLEDDFVV